MKVRTILAILAAGFIITCAAFFCRYWINTQPVSVPSRKTVTQEVLQITPEKNRQIINYIEANGPQLAPDYNGTVCTEFVIKVIDRFTALSGNEKNLVRIITNRNLDSLVRAESPIIRGVQTALLKNNKGFKVENLEEVRPGDLVQFWNLYQDQPYGHCGVVLEIQPNENITVYSSHPWTGGYGKQKFLWPDKIFFVRLN